MKKNNLFYIIGIALIFFAIVLLVSIRIIEGYDAVNEALKIYCMPLFVVGCSFLFIGILDKRKNSRR